MAWTIVLIHRGKPNYLRYNLHLLSRLSPHSNVILVGDKSNAQLVEQNRGYKWFSIEDLIQDNKAYQFFIQNYKHFSVNSFRYERFCFERWFILLNLAKVNQLEKFIYIDTDNFLLISPSYFLESYIGYDYGQTIAPSAPEFIFFQGIDVLSEFCNYLNNLYANSSEAFEKLVLQNTEKVWGGNHPSGAKVHFSDMWAMKDFWENNQGTGNQTYKFNTRDFKHKCIPNILPNKSINIHVFKTYKFNTYKFNGVDPSVSIFHKGEWLRVNMIHFQGGTKKYTRNFYLQFLHSVKSGKQFQCQLKPPSKIDNMINKISRKIGRIC